MTLEDVEACMEHYYRFEATKQSAKLLQRWLITGQRQDLSEMERAGVLKVKRG